MANQDESPRNSATTPTHDDVARRAYELFEARGGEPGHDLEHWLDAERELIHMSADVVTDQAGARRQRER